MLPESVSQEQRTCSCGYTVKKKDMFFVIEHGVWHLICYDCGSEFVI